MPRHLLTQPTKYIKDTNYIYSFMNDYYETIFLWQEFITGRWVVDCSPVSQASTSYVNTDLGNLQVTPIVSLRQCCLAVAAVAQAQGPVYNTTPKSECAVQTK